MVALFRALVSVICLSALCREVGADIAVTTGAGPDAGAGAVVLGFTQRAGRRRRCNIPDSEFLFNSIILGLFAEGLIPTGSVVDAGANDGSWSCLYAEADHSRSVHAIDPMKVNVERIAKTYTASLPNIKPKVGGLGSRPAIMLPPAGVRRAHHPNLATVTSRHMGTEVKDHSDSSTSGTFTIYTLDDLFANEKLGFAHLDLEGNELAALRGGAAVIMRDRPVLSVELHVHDNAMYTRDLLEFLDKLQYSAHLVEEVCGERYDCRNLVAVPKENGSAVHESPVMRVAAASERLFHVNKVNIADHAFSVACVPGGPCCKSDENHCCRHRCIAQWIGGELRQWGEAPNGTRDPRLYSRLEQHKTARTLAELVDKIEIARTSLHASRNARYTIAAID